MKFVWFGLAGLGLCMASIAILLFVRERAFVASAEETTGFVTGYELAGDEGESSYCAEIQFTTPQGQQVDFVVDECTDSRPYDIGDPVTVYYDPDDPEDGHRLKAFSEQWLGPTLLGACSSPLLLVGLIGAFLSLRKA